MFCVVVRVHVAVRVRLPTLSPPVTVCSPLATSVFLTRSALLMVSDVLTVTALVDALMTVGVAPSKIAAFLSEIF